MAWITKNSAAARIARRDEPYLTDAMKSDLHQRVFPRYETRLACTMPGLHLIQHQYGWVPAQAMDELAVFLGVSPAEVLDTASFYEEYWLKPKGRHLVSVCRSIACEFCGQPALTQAIKDALGIDVGETTDDGRFTLIELECLGACGGAPAILIDETLHEGVTPADVPRLLAQVAEHGH
ncbi:MAG: NADH-quinone oxidoreductase subunit NuoE [Phycisphaerales bacterium]